MLLTSPQNSKLTSTSAAWQTYSGNGFEFQYPPKWVLFESDVIDLYSYDPNNPDNMVKGKDLPDGEVRIEFGQLDKKIQPDKPLLDWFNENYPSQWETEVGTTEKIVSRTITKVGPLSAAKIVIQGELSVSNHLTYLLNNGDRVFTITVYGDYQNQKTSIDKLLSTFKFTK